MPAQGDRFQLAGGVLEGKFRVDRAVAEGGFGVVYRGTHLMLERPIALKVLKTPNTLNDAARAEFIDGFAREAKTSVRIDHPNIVQVLDFGVSAMPSGETAPWMVLEWLDGETLRDVLMASRGGGGRDPVDCLQLMRPAFEALAYAHEEGIAHRDIKPANIMLARSRRGTHLKVLDFGIAKVMHDGERPGSGETQTQSALNAFSLAYAAPEQVGGSRTGPWTDVHALGLIMTELLTDRPPFDGMDKTELCCDVLSPRRPTPAKRAVDVGAWEPVLAKALALRPGERFQNAGDFLVALEEALEPTTVSQNPAALLARLEASRDEPDAQPAGAQTTAPPQPGAGATTGGFAAAPGATNSAMPQPVPAPALGTAGRGQRRVAAIAAAGVLAAVAGVGAAVAFKKPARGAHASSPVAAPAASPPAAPVAPMALAPPSSPAPPSPEPAATTATPPTADAGAQALSPGARDESPATAPNAGRRAGRGGRRSSGSASQPNANTRLPIE